MLFEDNATVMPLILHPREDQRAVCAAKAKGVRDGNINFARLRRMWHQVEITPFIRIVLVNGGRRNIVTNGQNRKDSFNPASGT